MFKWGFGAVWHKNLLNSFQERIIVCISYDKHVWAVLKIYLLFGGSSNKIK